MDGFVQELKALGQVPRRDLIVALTMFAEDLSTDPAGVDELVQTLCDAIESVRFSVLISLASALALEMLSEGFPCETARLLARPTGFMDEL